jgi:hypothetical protein
VRSVELLHFSPESQRASGIFAALVRAAPIAIRQTTAYCGGSDVLMLWGPGASDRADPMRRQQADGGIVVACDLAYWDRDRKFRVSINAAHPQAWVMRRDWPDSRVRADRIARGNAWRSDGPVIVAGIGEKAHAQYGRSDVHAWEREQIASAERAGCCVRYRPKKHAANPFRVDTLPFGIPIDRALQGASAIVTWHSNVAVDAIRMGIPVVCRDGAAAAVGAPEWTPGLQPIAPELADRFLVNLAWFQWAPSEAAQAWAWLADLVS